jgi:hypothetical protein
VFSAKWWSEPLTARRSREQSSAHDAGGLIGFEASALGLSTEERKCRKKKRAHASIRIVATEMLMIAGLLMHN